MRGVVRVVTGGGKTVFAHLCITEFRRRHPSGKIVIIVPTSALLDQWYVSLVDDLRVPASDIACYSGEEKPDRPAAVNVFVINTARSYASRVASSGDWMLVVDECHRAGSPQNALALRGNYRAALGLSATPERDYDEGFTEFVQPAVGEVIFDYSYVDAAADGVISEFALHNVHVKMLPDEQDAFDDLSKKIGSERAKIAKGKGSEERLIKLLQRRSGVSANATMRVPAAVKLAEQHLGQRTIIFHERVAAADRILDLLTARHRSVTIYHAGITASVRRDNLRLYRRGIVDILVCCRALDEGINVPETAIAIVASSSASTRQRIQRLGRVLRPAKGKKFADIYTIYATEIEEQRLANEASRLDEICEVTWARVN